MYRIAGLTDTVSVEPNYEVSQKQQNSESLLDSLKTVLRFCKRKEKFISLFLAASLAVTEVIAPDQINKNMAYMHGRAEKRKKIEKGG